MRATSHLLNSLTTDAPVKNIWIGAFWTAVLLDTDPPRCGLASALRAETGGPWPPVKRAGRLLEQSGRELAQMLHSDRLLEASIGLAAVNALLEVDEGPLIEANAEEIISERATGRHVAIVGHFPFVKRVRKVAGECSVLELHPGPGDLPATLAAEVLPEADVIALTGTSLINGTFDQLIDLCRPDAFVLLLGPSAPLTPALFDAGVDAISGTRVHEPEQVVHSLTQGATFRQIKRRGGLRLLTWLKD